MRRLAVCLILLLVIDFGAAVVGEETVPDRDSLHAQTELDSFVRLFDPLWQGAWPARDWEALFAAGVDFADALPAIGAMKHSSRNTAKFTLYQAHRAALEQAIAYYRTETGKRDTARVAELFLRIRAELDSTIAAMRPIPFPLFDDFRHSVDRFVAERRDADDDSCLIPAVDSLLAHVAVLEQSLIPVELKERATMIREEFAYFRVLMQRISGVQAQGDRKGFRLLSAQLQTRVNNFARLYLQ